MLEASRFTIEKKIEPMLRELEGEGSDWEKLEDMWTSHVECGFCREWDTRCPECRLWVKEGLGYCYYQDWYKDILGKLKDHDLTVFGDIIDVWYCYENLKEAADVRAV